MMRLFQKTPKTNEIWFDPIKQKHFYIVDKVKTDYEVYKPYDVIYENNQTRYLTSSYIRGQCVYKGKAKYKFKDIFEIK